VRELALETERRTQLLDVTDVVRGAVAGEQASIVVLFVPHTTAGLVLQASGEGATHVATDIASALERIVDESWDWQHTSEGDRNPWSHVRSALTAASLSIPMRDGEIVLGDLQRIFFCEFDGPRSRRLVVSVI
jgi:secondary thiamine-phosphate synthase enzyme